MTAQEQVRKPYVDFQTGHLCHRREEAYENKIYEE
jgi:hypothetical protein